MMQYIWQSILYTSRGLRHRQDDLDLKNEFHNHISANLLSTTLSLHCKSTFWEIAVGNIVCLKYGAQCMHHVTCPLHYQPISRILAGQSITRDERSIQCRDLMKNHNELLQNMYIQFQESGYVSGYILLKLSQNEFEDKTKWEKLISVFAFSTKLMNIDNSDLISKWLMHVLLQNSSVWM